MVLPYLKGLINKVNHFYLYSDLVISWVYLHCLIFSYQIYSIQYYVKINPYIIWIRDFHFLSANL